MVELCRWSWRFHSPQPARSALTAALPEARFADPASPTEGFTVTFTVNLKPFDGERTILEIPGVLRVVLRKHDPADRNPQNYPAFKMPDGSAPVLEANLGLRSVEHPEWTNMVVGIPLAMLPTPEGEHDVVLNFSGVRWTMYVDGELLDNDFPFGYPQWSARNTWKLDAQYVKAAALHLPGIEPERTAAQTPAPGPGIQYWLPRGHNNWVGDVATIFHKGRYHVFYLYDRRHHNSKFGRGAHYFEHISTSDFLTWTEHEAATPLEEQWECIGTGVPFVFQGKLCVSYGLHTTRVYPREETTLPVQWDYLKAHGRTGTFPRATTPGAPAGSTYAVCTEGFTHFTKSNIMFHPCENPSVYTDPSGQLRLLANAGSNGIWESDTVDGGWRCVSEGFPPGGDCTFFFRWGAFDYIIGGFTGLWSKPAGSPDSAYQDVVTQGLDFYDGSNVPSIVEVTGGRFLMAAWIPIRGWGGNLVIRELVQRPDGRIGSKWMPEITPAAGKSETLAAKLTGMTTFPAAAKAFLLSFTVQPAQAKKGRFGIAMLPANGEEAACEWQVSLDNARAQFAPGTLTGFAGREKTLREGGAPHSAGDYAIENLIDVEKPFTVRLIVKNCDKIGGALVDAEIAGCRTMISYRRELTVKKLVFRAEGVELKDVQVAPLVER
ncbi:MAG: hypothetical protein NTV86_03135 [Planctomycetota bacterium]|nr:hypothetical protein [Planctomycetota bacterium]